MTQGLIREHNERRLPNAGALPARILLDTDGVEDALAATRVAVDTSRPRGIGAAPGDLAVQGRRPSGADRGRGSPSATTSRTRFWMPQPRARSRFSASWTVADLDYGTASGRGASRPGSCARRTTRS